MQNTLDKQMDELVTHLLSPHIDTFEASKTLYLFKQELGDKGAFNTAIKKCRKFHKLVDKVGNSILYNPKLEKDDEYYIKYPNAKPTEEDKKFYHWREDYKKDHDDVQ